MFRILSLDGGGIKGAFTASVLSNLENATGQSVAEHFDLIAGTSTGGLIAVGLGLGFSADELLQFYQLKGPKIFPSTGTLVKSRGIWRQLWGAKHSHTPLRQALIEVLGDRKFGDSKVRLVIPTYDAIAGRIFLLKTAHHDRFKHDINASAVDVAMATSAAPTYFQAASFPEHGHASYVDGGVWANNPTLVGIVEAVSFLNIDLKAIDVLSIGTTTQPFNIAKHKDSGALKWNRGIVDLMFQGQTEASLKQSSLLVDGRVHRIDATVESGRFSLDSATNENISELVELGRGEALKKDNLSVVKERFLNGEQAEKFRPIHGL